MLWHEMEHELKAGEVKGHVGNVCTVIHFRRREALVVAILFSPLYGCLYMLRRS